MVTKDAIPQMDWLTMTDTTQAGPTLRAWIRAHRSAFGRWLFARTVCKRAPYFGTIKPKFLDLQPKLCRVSMQKRRAVENHIHTVHALAMGNLCELAAGLCMTIEYLAKAETDVIATARLDKTEWAGAENIGVPVTVTDTNGKEVVRAVISMYVSPKKES
jgi:acyl-coenzyme A thioesterase PaaI-like protein